MRHDRFNKQQPGMTKAISRAVVSISITLLALGLAPGTGNRVLAELDGVCVMYCDDGGGYDSGGYDSGGGYGYGGGCASAGYDDAYYNAPTAVGQYHSEHPNVVWDGEYWQPAEGYHYVSDDPYDYTVARNIGASHPTHPNVVWDGQYWAAADGFHYVSDDPDDYRVERDLWADHPYHPNVHWDGEYWVPYTGYHYASDDPDDFTVARNIGSVHEDFPNTYWNGESWEPAEGYIWASSDVDDLTTVLRSVGSEHPEYPNTTWNGESWSPAEGYTWASDDPDDLSVVLLPEPEPELVPVTTQQAMLSDTDSLPTGPTLKIADVPSPSGYTTEAERREQLAKLSDEHIDRELVRIRQTLERMKADFENDTGDLGDWLKEAQQAEDDALKDSFGLLVGGSLDRFADTWDQFPRLKAIAKDGLGLAGKVDQAIKMAEDPTAIAHHRELMRDKMMEAYKIMVEEGREVLSEQGPKAVELMKFMVDYSYHMTRWGLARNQINAIVDNLDGPNGRLEAQLAIKELQEDLMAERERRQASAQ